MKTKKLIIFLFIMMLNLAVAFAGNTYTFNFFDQASGNPVSQVTAVYYKCNVENCLDTTEPQKFATKNSGASNSISQEFLGTSTNADYLVPTFAQCYLPLSIVVPDDRGSGLSGNFDWHMFKGQNCHAPIYSYSVTNSVEVNHPVQVDVVANLDAQTDSAFHRTGFPPLFTPQGYESYFSAQTRITLEIIKDGTVIHTTSYTKEILADTTENVHFEWTPTQPGTYTARIKTEVTDCQCSSQITEYVSKDFTVTQTAPQGECYTLLNNIRADDMTPMVGQNINILVDKQSFFASQQGALTPIPADLSWTITNIATGQVVFSTTTHPLATQTTSSISWTPTQPGQYLITITALANSLLCSGLTNTPETIQMTIVVTQPQECTPGQIDTIQCGQTDVGACSFGIQSRSCQGNGQWTPYGACTGAVNPSTEACNGLDDDCDGQTDENEVCTPQVCTPGQTQTQNCNSGLPGVCQSGTQTRTCQSNGQWGNFGTCSPNIFPGTILEICNNGVDDDCDGLVDGNDPNCFVCQPGQVETIQCGVTDVGVCSLGIQTRTCQANGQFGPFGQCVGAVNPGPLNCNNGLDNDCDGIIDANEPGCFVCQPGQVEFQTCNTGFLGVCQAGTQSRTCQANGQFGPFGQCTAIIFPGTQVEICNNNLDDDCDGLVDGNDPNCFVCQPGQVETIQCGVTDVGVCSLGIQTRTCQANGQFGPFGQCVGAVNPSAEICNGLDDNCDGQTDETFPTLGQVCTVGVGQCMNTGLVVCANSQSTTCSATPFPPSIEICNGLDDDCDGVVDNGNICNMAPVANAGPDQTALVGEVITLNGNASFDPDGTIVSYTWQISDGTTLNGAIVTHSFITAGVYTATLTVTDNLGATGQDQAIITVEDDQNLTVTISAYPTKGDAPLQVFFTSNVTGGNAPFTYYWNFGDGQWSAQPNPTHIFSTEGLFHVTLTVTDRDGDTGQASIDIDTRKDHVINPRAAIYISEISLVDETIKTGDNMEVVLSFQNRAGKTLKDSTVTVSIPELGMHAQARTGNLKDNEIASKIFVMKLPAWAPYGKYYLRTTISANSGDIRRTEYREITIGPNKCVITG